MPFQQKTVKYLTSSDGTTIYADAVGNTEGPNMIFVHGHSLSAAVFDDIFKAEKYSQNFFFVRYDLRGHGRSAKPENREDHASHLYAHDFKAVMDAFGLRKPLLVGWSLGATLSADIASHLPEGTICGIACLAGLPYLDPNLFMKVTKPFAHELQPDMFVEESTSKALMAGRRFIDSLFFDAQEVPWAIRTSWLGMWAMQSTKVRELTIRRPQDPTKFFELAKKGLPFLNLGGRYDTAIDSQAAYNELQASIPNMKLAWIEERGGHAMFFDNMEATMTEIIDFMQNDCN